MLLYNIVKPLGRIGLALFYKKVMLINEHNVPKDKAVIVASNHPTAFIEPTILGCWLSRRLHFIVRGDLFTHPIYRKMLLSLHMIPIYRRIDVKEYASLKKNFDTLDYCYDLLGRKELIHILAEGNTIQEKRLRPIQKGAARMAFGAIDKYGEDLDLYIIPTGVNYTEADKPRTEVMIEFGTPIRLKDYIETYKLNKNRAIKQLTGDLTTRLKPLIVTIERVEDEELTEHLFTMYRNEFPETIWPVTERTYGRLKAEKQTAQYVNELSEDENSALTFKVNNYFKALKKNKTTDIGVRRQNYASFTNTLFTLLGWLPSSIGIVLNYLPIWYGKSTAQHKVKQREFKAPVMVATFLGGFILYYLMWMIAAMLIGQTWFWVFVLLLPFLGVFGLLYSEFYQKWKAAKRFKQLDSSIRQQLIQTRKEIIDLAFWK